jgi:hypothetical protein
LTPVHPGEILREEFLAPLDLSPAERAMTSSTISCRMRDWSRRSGIASASRRHTPVFPSALSQQQEPGIGGLVSTGEINCEFLALDG